MKTYIVTTNSAKNINDFAYQFIRLEDGAILYSNLCYVNVKKYAKMVELENYFAGVHCTILYEC